MTVPALDVLRTLLTDCEDEWGVTEEERAALAALDALVQAGADVAEEHTRSRGTAGSCGCPFCKAYASVTGGAGGG